MNKDTRIILKEYFTKHKLQVSVGLFMLCAATIFILWNSSRMKLVDYTPKSGQMTRWSTIKLNFNKPITNVDEIVVSTKLQPESKGVDILVKGNSIYLVPVSGLTDSNEYILDIPAVKSGDKTASDIRLSIAVGKPVIEGQDVIDEGDYIGLKYPKLVELSERAKNEDLGYELSLAQGASGRIQISLEIKLIKKVDEEREDFIAKVKETNQKAIKDIESVGVDLKGVDLVYINGSQRAILSGESGD
jgi:hypothetical protein